MKLSILMPAIRPEKWDGVLRSVVESAKTITGSGYTIPTFELIVVSPLPLPQHLEKAYCVKYVKDFGSPTRCFNIAALVAEGEYLTWVPDDGLYTPNSLRIALEKMEGSSENKILVFSQVEAARHYSADFCFINKHPEISSPHIPDSYRLFPTAMMHTSYFLKLGGLDCRYQGHAMAHNDFAIRAQRDGAEVEFMDRIVMNLEHMPGTSGDHAPMHFSQLEEDEPLYRALYRNLPLPPIKIDINNWKQADTCWSRRFKVK